MNTFNFTEEDKQKVVDFLNQVATHATLTLKTNELISYYKNLAYMQQVFLPKLNANILEVKKVYEASNSTAQGGE